MNNETNTFVPMGMATTSPVREGPASCEAISSLVCAIVGLFVMGVILGPIAICLGISANAKIKRDPVEHGGQCLATAGIVIGTISFASTLLVNAMIKQS